MRILAIDFGTRRLGLAISDGKLALAVGVEERQAEEDDRALAGRMAERAKEEGADSIVVGLPRRADGGSNPMSERIRRFADILRHASGLTVDLFDEGLSSEEARRRLRDSDIPRSKKKGHVNVVAAQVILEGYLNSRGS